ncbi:hypothetical protein QUF63_12110 [Anaerolineales bacterium HSG25]|nr:hypothetical protein [Anaerolineales bacterium HSG25]
MQKTLPRVQNLLEPEKLFELWSQGKLSTEEALRQIMQQNVRQYRALDALNITAKNLRADMDDLIAQTGIKPKLSD